MAESSGDSVESMRIDLIRGICAAANGDMETADAILDRYWPGRPKMPEVRALNQAEIAALITGAAR